MAKRGMPYYTRLERKLRSCGIIRPTATLQAALDWYMARLSAIDDTSDVEDVTPVIIFTHCITDGDTTILGAVFYGQFRYLEKLADYRLVCCKVRSACARLTPELRQSLSAKRVCLVSIVFRSKTRLI